MTEEEIEQAIDALQNEFTTFGKVRFDSDVFPRTFVIMRELLKQIHEHKQDSTVHTHNRMPAKGEPSFGHQFGDSPEHFGAARYTYEEPA